ncbi:MAG TPA: TonB-dependent receptor, partial [Opitutaceae bacterium]|nr:TonB-dependent receptor [Opitutaceae bacterium]
RPPVANIIATLTENPDTMTISAGNPDLKPYHSDNFELSVEKYFEPVGMFSAGVFLKEITDYFRTLVTPLGPGGIDGSGLYANYQLSQSVNVGDARIRGFELSYQQQLTFLPGVLRGLGVFANYSYQQAQGSFGTVNFERQLANLPPRNANGGISYRGYGFQVNFLANWTAEKYKGNVGTIPVYNEARTLLDLKIQYSVNRNYDLFLDISNLTDEAPRTDVSKNGLYFFRTNQGVSFVAGVKALF